MKSTDYIVSGRMRSGKSTLATTIVKSVGGKIISLADPIKLLVDAYCPPWASKDNRRQMYQYVGQIGRGLIDASHPLTVERWNMTKTIWEDGESITGLTDVDWSQFGEPNFWLNAALSRAERSRVPVVIDDGRFSNEITMALASGFRHIHVMCNESSRLSRCGNAGAYHKEVDENISEQMAIALDGYFSGSGSEYEHMLPDESVLENTFVLWTDDGTVGIGVTPAWNWLAALQEQTAVPQSA